MQHTNNQPVRSKEGNMISQGFKAKGIEETLIGNGTFAVVAMPGLSSGN